MARKASTAQLAFPLSPRDAQLLDVAGAASHLGTPVRFVRRLIAERRIPFYKVGRYVRIDKADLEDFIAAGRVDAQQRY
jgi:excisionase family DNA binding protein